MLDNSYENDIPLVFTDYNEVAKRPNFRAEIDTSQHKVDRIISTSLFPEKHPCGKKDCHQPHKTGWIVVTADGLETLVGSKCGQEWGGDRFSLQRAAFTRRIKRESQLKTINTFVRDIEKIIDRVNEIKNRKHGANWLSKTINKLQSECHIELFNQLKRRAGRGETAVTKDVLKDKTERDIELAMDKGASISAYRTETVGHLIGLEVLTFDLRKVLIEDILNKVVELKAINPSTLASPALNKLAQDLGAIETRFNQSEEILRYGLEFFSTENNFKLIKAMDKANKHNNLTKVDWLSGQ